MSYRQLELQQYKININYFHEYQEIINEILKIAPQMLSNNEDALRIREYFQIITPEKMSYKVLVEIISMVIDIKKELPSNHDHKNNWILYTLLFSILINKPEKMVLFDKEREKKRKIVLPELEKLRKYFNRVSQHEDFLYLPFLSKGKQDLEMEIEVNQKQKNDTRKSIALLFQRNLWMHFGSGNRSLSVIASLITLKLNPDNHINGIVIEGHQVAGYLRE